MSSENPELDVALLEAIKAFGEAISVLSEAANVLKAILEQTAEQGKWLPISVAAERVGGVSPNWILTRIRDGRYKHGVHFVDSSDGSRPNYLVSVAAIRKEMSKPPERRNTCRQMMRGAGRKGGSNV